MLLGAENGVQLYDVGVRELGEVLDFADGVRGDAVFVGLGADFDLLDGDEAGRVVSVVSTVDDGVGSFAETGA